MVIPFSLAACATTQQATSATEECSLVDQDMTGTKITKKQECKDASGTQGAPAPQR
jgi:hypothetical protein